MASERAKAKGKSRVGKPPAAARQTAKAGRKATSAQPGKSAKRGAKIVASPIDQRTQSLSGWRAETLAQARRLIHEADPEIVEERKWMKPTNPAGVPVWSHAGIVCTGEIYKQVVKLTFVRGASLADPAGLFNASLDGNTRRAIDIREGETLDAKAFKALIQAAVAENLRASRPKSPGKRSQTPPKLGAKSGAKSGAKAGAKAGGKSKPVKLLSGGNPQIAKAEGDAPVQAYIAAMPGWKSGLGQRLDALIVQTVPHVRKAVKWNSPFYGVEGQGWFLSFHVFTKYVKVTFFAGTSLRPVPPGGTPKSKDVRWIDIHEGDQLDESQMATWIRQAAAIPGWIP